MNTFWHDTSFILHKIAVIFLVLGLIVMFTINNVTVITIILLIVGSVFIIASMFAKWRHDDVVREEKLIIRKLKGY